jgi:hypothetical protein
VRASHPQADLERPGEAACCRAGFQAELRTLDHQYAKPFKESTQFADECGQRCSGFACF